MTMFSFWIYIRGIGKLNGFFFRNSWGTDWGNNGCGYLPFIDWSRVVEAWVGVSQRRSILRRKDELLHEILLFVSSNRANTY